MNTLNITIEREPNGFHVSTSEDNGNYWGVGIVFPSLSGAHAVAGAIASASEAEHVEIRVKN